MKAIAFSGTAPAAAWTEILDRVEEGLRRCLAEAAEPDTEPQVPPGSASVQEAGWRERLEQCAARLRQLQDCVRQAEDHAEEADSALRGSEEALQGWLAVAASARQRLE